MPRAPRKKIRHADVSAIPPGVLVNKDVALAFAPIGLTTLWAWEKAGKFPAARLRHGKSVLWLVDDLRAFARGEWRPVAETAQ